MTLSGINKAAPVIAMAALLFSCKGETSYTSRIDNYSNDIITFSIYRDHREIPDTVMLAPGKSYTLSVTTSDGKVLDAPACTGNLDSLKAMTLDGKILVKDILDPDEWNYRMIEDKTGRSADHFCDFEIFQKDLKY